MPEINPLTNNQIFLKKIAENTGSNYETGDVSEINPLTIDQIFLKEIAANTAGQSGDITELEGKVADNAGAIEAMINVTGSCNLYCTCIPQSLLGITQTVDSNGVVTLNGTASDTCDLYNEFAVPVKSGRYIIDGLSEGLSFIVNLDGNWIEAHNGDTLSVAMLITNIAIRVPSGTTLTDVKCYPMLYDARLNPTGYVPYSMTNRELTERFKVLTIPVSSVNIGVASSYLLYNNPCPTGYIPISAMFDRGSVSNDGVLLTVYLDSGTDVRVNMYNFSNSSIELNGSVKVLCIKA